MSQGMLLGPAYAISKVLADSGLSFADIGVWEIHEAFAGKRKQCFVVYICA